MGMKRKSVLAEVCPHCGKSVANLKPVPERTLEAAKCILKHGIDTSAAVAEDMQISVGYASMLLSRANEAGLVSIKSRESSHVRGGAQYVYTPSQKLRAYAPVAYRIWAKNQRNIAA